MTQEIEAIYQDGVFRPLQAVSLAESQTVKIIVSTSSPAESGRDWDLLARAKAEVAGIPNIPSIQEVREMLSHIPGSLSRDVIAERGDY
jgi:predicted DNA-binding antitoxin AbrB/MazE fold protein